MTEVEKQVNQTLAEVKEKVNKAVEKGQTGVVAEITFGPTTIKQEPNA